MKDLFKIAAAAALAAVIVELARRAGMTTWRERQVPTLRPVADAVPRLDEPLGEEDLRVAQNAPF